VKSLQFRVGFISIRVTTHSYKFPSVQLIYKYAGRLYLIDLLDTITAQACYAPTARAGSQLKLRFLRASSFRTLAFRHSTARTSVDTRTAGERRVSCSNKRKLTADGYLTFVQYK